jgi:hypothetical protein
LWGAELQQQQPPQPSPFHPRLVDKEEGVEIAFADDILVYRVLTQDECLEDGMEVELHLKDAYIDTTKRTFFGLSFIPNKSTIIRPAFTHTIFIK